MVRANSITAFDAKNRLGSLLDRVQGGEELIITRHGQPVAKLVPVNKHTDDEVSEAFETFRRIRESMAKSGTKVSRDEIKKWRGEGRR
jgi:prevent-host-death family protein